ncbi:MAG: insulinase family protein, partial [Hyphomicrobiaceae bacterium]|nr:insulinase family protein [Hyphomicrobiaceae bacterium]
EPVERRRPQEPATFAERRVTLSDPHVSRPSIEIQFIAPSYATDAKAAAALDVLSEILGGGPTSRLYRAIVVEQGLATSAGSYMQGTSLDPSSFGFYAQPRPGVTMEALEAALRAEIDKVLADGVSTVELRTAQRTLIADAIFAQDNQATLARIFGASLAAGETIDMVQNWPHAIAAVTAEEVLEAARAVFDRDRSAVGILLPENAGGRS